MISAEEFASRLEGYNRTIQARFIRQRDLEQRIAGLEEAQVSNDFWFYPHPDPTALPSIIANLRKELNAKSD